MGILVKGPHGLIHSDIGQLEDTLQRGNGTTWAGDPRLILRQRVIARRTPTGGTQKGRRYEVWRECEDGEWRLIGHWRIEEYDKILPDLIVMAAAVNRPSVMKPATERIDEANAALEKHHEETFVERNFDHYDHLARLMVERREGRHRIRQVGGEA